MAYYLVRARPLANLAELRAQLESGEINQLRPFGGELHQCLLNARVDDDGFATWEENCYCNPPLAQEREILDRYFVDLMTQTIQKGAGWSQIDNLPNLWTINPLT